MCWVKQLAVLVERFHQSIHAFSVDWNKNLLSGTTLLHQISCEEPGILASQLEDEDAASLKALNVNDILYEPSRLNDLNARWRNLADNAKAYAIADNNIGQAMGELAKVF